MGWNFGCSRYYEAGRGHVVYLQMKIIHLNAVYDTGTFIVVLASPFLAIN